MLKKTWGEQIAGNFSIGLIFGLSMTVILIGGSAAAVAVCSATQDPLFAVLIFAILVPIILVLALISSTLSGIYSAAVYRYAVNGETGVFFQKEMVENAFRLK